MKKGRAENVVSLAKLDKILNATETEEKIIPCDVDGEHIEIRIKPYISLPEMTQMAQAIAENMFDDWDEYRADLKESVIALQAINYFTNIKIASSEDGTATGAMVRRLERMMYGSPLWEVIEEELCKSKQYWHVVDAANALVKHKLRMQEAAAQDKLIEMRVRMDSAIDAFESFTHDLDGKDLSAVLDTLKTAAQTDPEDLSASIVKGLASESKLRVVENDIKA